MKDSKQDPVLIAGAGPTGMTAAMELARFGIPVRIVERLKGPRTTSRALAVQARTLELFEPRGLADKLLKLGNPVEGVSAYGGGKQIFRLRYDRLDSRYNFALFVSQATTEGVLRDALDRAGIKIEWGVEMVAFAQPERKGEITATLRHDDGTLEEITASYLIDCEGAHSIARTTLDLQFDGDTLDDTYILGDFSIEGDLPENDLYVFSSTQGFIALFPLGNRRFRMVADNPINKPSKDTNPTIEELQKIYDTRLPLPVKFQDMNWSSWFNINSRMIPRLQVNRIFFGGDAAHIHSPAGGQGMNTGIQDMIDLSWKLAMVIKQQASHALLTTYGEDRLPVIKDVVTKSEKMTDLFAAKNPLLRAAFNEVAPLVVGQKFVQTMGARLLSQISLNYRDSSLSETHGHSGNLRGGDRIPDMSVTTINANKSTDTSLEQKRLFELFNPTKFTLLLIQADGSTNLKQQVELELTAWKNLIDSVRIAPDKDETQRERFTETFGSSSSVVLVRPDAYVGFVGNQQSVLKLKAYLQKWLTSDEAPVAGGAHTGHVEYAESK